MGALTGLVQKGGRGATAIKAKSPAFCTFRERMEAKLGQIFCARMGCEQDILLSSISLLKCKSDLDL